MSSNFRQITILTPKLSALERLKKLMYNVVTSLAISFFILAGKELGSNNGRILYFLPLAISYGHTVLFVSDLVGNPEDRFSHGATQYNRMVFCQIRGAQSVARLASEQLDTLAVQVRNPLATLRIFGKKNVQLS